ncbi:MAG: phosphoenolpyruvate carboxylase [Candidatus Dormibacteria bacterium]
MSESADRWAVMDGMPGPLRADLEHLGTVLEQVLAESGGPGLVTDVADLRRATIRLRQARGSAAAVTNQRVVDLVASLDLDRAERVAQAFTVYFQLVNLAEERHRARSLRERADQMVPESLAACVAAVRAAVGDGALADLLSRLEVRPVLTAHPTEARRRAVVEALRRISELMERGDSLGRTSGEHMDAERGLYEQVTILWRTAQLRHTAPTPLDEVRTVTAIFDETLFELVPRLCRALERALVDSTAVGRARPQFLTFLRWGSWVGGDREGNPAVTAEVTRLALDVQADHALRALEASASRIGRSLTMSASSTPPSAALAAALSRDRRAMPAAAEEICTRAPAEPHRQWLLLLAERLRATRLGEPGAYPDATTFRADLGVLQASLAEAGAERAAYGELQNLVWQAETFGFTFASLEVRQHARVHARVLQELLEATEPPDAETLDRIALLGWPSPVTVRSDESREVLATLRTMGTIQARWGADACRRYVVSFTRRAADVVGVLALARLADPTGGPVLDVVPLFESRADLGAAPQVLESLFQLPGWRRWLEARGRRLEVMLGYSDATKDAGFLAANLALYRAQAALAAWARAHAVDLILFHGRGGAVGRGGGPAGRAIRGQAPGSVDGRFKVTEQGEVMFARYSNPAIGMRHLEQVTSAVIQASIRSPEAVPEPFDREFEREADLMAEASEAAYRRLVESSGFAEFFAAVSPLAEIGQLRIGSRPGRRTASPGLGGLRAIPWVFAWAQTRVNLPGWYGLGSGLEAVAERHGAARLQQMEREWPFFRSVLENAEMSLAKADPMIAGLYLSRGGRPDLVALIRDEFRRTRAQVTLATGHERMLAGHPVLRRAVDLRNPYVDALSFLQLRFLAEARGQDAGHADDQSRLVDLVLQTVNGVAAGLQNTG